MSEGIGHGYLEGPQMAISAICRLVQPESGQRWKFRESVLIAVRRVVVLSALPIPCRGFHRYTAALTARCSCARSRAVSRKHLAAISKCNRSWGHRERTLKALHPASGHLARFSKVQVARGVVC